MTERDNRPLGKLFSEVYRERGAPDPDSKKFRVQTLAILEDLFRRNLLDQGELHEYLKREAGMVVEVVHSYYDSTYRYERFISESPIDDLLDFITFVARCLSQKRVPVQNVWNSKVQAAFDAQNLCYELDSLGGVHHRIDAAYSQSKSLTLACLADAKFAAAHDEIEKAFGFLTAIPPDYKMAVVNAFLAAENVFKTLTDTNNGLAKGTVEKALGRHVQRFYNGADSATSQAGMRLVESFASWSNACHPYRHGQNGHEVVAPPEEIAITLVTAGADFIRWLVELAKLNRETEQRD